MARQYSRSDIEIDRYDDRRTSYAPRGSSRYDDRQFREEDFRRGSGPLPPTREREVSDARGPAYLREDYGRSGAGPMVLRAREREDFEFAPRPRHRSPSPEQKKEREEIIIRRDERSESRGPPPRREASREREEIIIRRDERESVAPPPPRMREPEQSREREEIIIRRDERESLPPPRRYREPEQSREREEIIIRRDERDREPRRPPPPREVSREREEIIIRRDERDREPRRPPPPTDVSRDRDEIIIRREETDSRSRFDDDLGSRRSIRPAPSRGDYERSEIIVRRDEVDDDRYSRVGSRRYADDYALARPTSHERARSRHRSSSSGSQEEIIIRRDERDGRSGDREKQEIIIRRSSRSRSSSPAASVRTAPRTASVPEPQVIYAPQIHQEVITHHRHVDHGYEVALSPRPYSRPPSPPSPPPPAPREMPRTRDRSRSQERIQIKRSGERNGRSYDEDIIIDRNEGARSVPPPDTRYSDSEFYPPARREPSPMPPGHRRGWEDDAVAEEAEYYNDRALSRGYPGEALHGATRDWGLVDIPPGTKRVTMDGAGGGAQEITWQRYNGNRRAKFIPDSDADLGYSSEVGRPIPRPLSPIPPPAPAPESAGTVGPRYGKQRDPRDGLWTEVTKDLVVKEAILEMGYEYEETDEFYYIFRYMGYEDMARLVGLSEDIKKDRFKRIKEIQWENRVQPPPAIESPRDRLAIEAPPSPARSDRDRWGKDEERYIEREVVYRGGRPPPPVGWRRY